MKPNAARFSLFSVVFLLCGAALVYGQQTGSYSEPAAAKPSKSASAQTNSGQSSTPAAAAQAVQNLENAQNPTPAPVPGGEPLIGPGDLLKIGVLGAPDYDQEVRVGGNGDVVLALVGAVHVGGMNPEQAGNAIRTRLMSGGFFADPQVSVFEKEYATQGVSVLGEVQKPGVYPIVGPRHLFDVISLAGGTTPKAGRVVSVTHRDQPNKVETVNLSNDPQTNVAANVPVLPGDTVVVSRAGIVYVVGDVRIPTGVVMDNGGQLTVLQAIAMAQGTMPTAALSKSKIIRKTEKGPEEIHISLKKIMAAKTPDVQLQAGDIVFVPSSAAKSAAARGLNAAVSLAATVVAYRTVY